MREIKGGAVTAAHLLKFDSVHGRWTPEVEAEGGDRILIDGTPLNFSEHSQPHEVPWEDLGVDLVLECSGKFRTPATLDPYFKRGVQKVIVAAPVKEEALNIVMGVNDQLYEPEKHHLLTAASCTTNCLAPVVKVIHEGLGIKHGIITTIHDNTNTQTIVDAPHKDLRRARATSLSLIPTTTGSATAIGLIYPELNGKLNGLAVRVPLLKVFAFNSAVHSYLVLAFTDDDKVALNVGFYYMANSGGRLIGTVLSGLIYQFFGLVGCLWTSMFFVLAAALISLKLPDPEPSKAIPWKAGDGD
jgi:glyceraldehyde-3-phosphate dehydrogenase type I